jgi:predicted nucleic acid-binding protein
MATTEAAATAVVSDAGPIIHLDELGCLDLLGDLGRVLIPRVVWGEVVRHRRALTVIDVPNGELADAVGGPSARLLSLGKSLGLHVGELAALALMESGVGRMLLCDDAAARLAAEALGMVARGTIGILVRSARTGRRTRVEVIDLLKALPDRCTLHISRKLLADVVAELEGAPPEG